MRRVRGEMGRRGGGEEGRRRERKEGGWSVTVTVTEGVQQYIVVAVEQ